MRVIAVVMGEPDSKTRNKEVTELLDYTYAQYDLNVVMSKNKGGLFKFVAGVGLGVGLGMLFAPKKGEELRKNGDTILGIIFDYSQDDVYYCIKGQGAFCNGKPIRTSDCDKLNNSIIYLTPLKYML